MLIQSISETNLDIIGDIHGEISALENLLGHLGYDEKGNHPENRTLVFVGDLVDRGENSWAVYKSTCTHGSKGRLLHFRQSRTGFTLKTSVFKMVSTKSKGNEWFHGLIELVNKDDPSSIQPQFL